MTSQEEPQHILTKPIQTKIKSLCKKLWDVNRAAKIIDQKKDQRRTSTEVNLDGKGAEYWFKGKYNIPFDLDDDLSNPSATRQRTYKADIDVVINNKTIEIKNTRWKTGCLFIPGSTHYGKPRELIRDIYVLVIGGFPDYNKAFFITREELLKINDHKPRMNWKIGSNGYYADQHELHATLEDALAYDEHNSPGPG